MKFGGIRWGTVKINMLKGNESEQFRWNLLCSIYLIPNLPDVCSRVKKIFKSRTITDAYDWQ